MYLEVLSLFMSMSLLPKEVSKGCQILWTWSYRQL